MGGDGTAHAVVLAADRNFQAPLAVALSSVLANRTDQQTFDVYVLTPDIGPAEREHVVRGLAPDAKVTWVDVPPSWYAGLRIIDYLTVTTAFRLMIAEVLPPAVRRAVYLDADTLVRHSLDRLFELDLGDHVLGAVADAGHPWIGTVHSLPWQTLGLDPSAPYFNGGMLVIDVEKWRAQAVGQRALDLMRTYKFAYADQCALNAVTNGQFTQVNLSYNTQADHFSPKEIGLVHVSIPAIEREAAIHDPAVVHFSNGGVGVARPWFANSQHPFAAEWLTVRSTTAFADQPLKPNPLPTRSETIRRRVRRAAYILARG